MNEIMCGENEEEWCGTWWKNTHLQELVFVCSGHWCFPLSTHL